MDRIKEYVNELNGLKTEATNLINGIKDSEGFLETAIDSIREEMKRTYIQEGKRIIDEVAERELNKIEKEESRLGPQIVKTALGALSTILAQKTEESELARTLYKPVLNSYELDKTSKRQVKQAAEIAKHRLEEHVLNMKGEEFMKSLKGERAMHKLLHTMLRMELNKLGLDNLMSVNDAGYTLQSR